MTVTPVGSARSTERMRARQTRQMDRVHDRCDACGFDGAGYTDAALLDGLRSLGDRWRRQLAAAGDHVRSRPEPDTWSALEYAAHSRDITALHVYGVEQALTDDEPAFPPIGDDLIESAASTYHDEVPETVLDVLAATAGRLAQLADDAGAGTWSRGLTVGETRSDVRFLLEHALHDSLHHLDDVQRGLTVVVLAEHDIGGGRHDAEA